MEGPHGCREWPKTSRTLVHRDPCGAWQSPLLVGRIETTTALLAGPNPHEKQSWHPFQSAS
eukprot:7253519-Pyramimonas_sp.AAC.1